MRKFEEVEKTFKKFPDVETKLPERADNRSAGYDFYSKEDYNLKPNESHVFWTDIRAAMYFDNVLMMYTRSGNGCKNGIILRNNTGIIDASYYKNPKNDGNIGICLMNTGNEIFEIKTGDRIAQGVFSRYLIAEDDKYLTTHDDVKRFGGFGSTGK